ncbi:type II secretion system protein [Orenia metallireducens]|uniref:Type II secretion system protein n=1 Tax=Orenia metallireducens TaxID=1413210 RepID=A0A1C0A6V3_9FIRM|nr:type II secretion system F family protein [Orenia metallireducens]OCL25995.1 type II secretion system protein [Orenia metallireducens]
MAQFTYKAINQDTGQTVEGIIDADNSTIALEKIEAKNLSPFSLEEGTKVEIKDTTSLFINKENNLILFTSQLANLLKSGIQLGEALGITQRLIKEGKFKEIIVNLNKSLKGGKHFAEALSDYPNYFSDSYISMIKAGEEGGFLDLSCQRLAQDLEDHSELKSFIISSLIYPMILLLVALLAILVMITYVLPKFSMIYGKYGKSLPFSTKLLLDISQFISSNGLIIAIITLVTGLGIWQYYQSENGKKRLDQFILKIPILGSLITDLTIVKITRSIGSMLINGVSLIKALEVSRYLTNNSLFRRAIVKSITQVQRGNALSEALAKTEVFPEIVIYMIGVGEETGRLGTMLVQISENFEKNSRKKIEKLMKAFEPLVIFFMGLIIGLIVISMLLPILGVNNISI